MCSHRCWPVSYTHLERQRTAAGQFQLFKLHSSILLIKSVPSLRVRRNKFCAQVCTNAAQLRAGALFIIVCSAFLCRCAPGRGSTRLCQQFPADDAAAAVAGAVLLCRLLHQRVHPGFKMCIRDRYLAARQGMATSDFSGVTLLLPKNAGLSELADQINSAWQKECSLFFSVEEVEQDEFDARIAAGKYTIALAPIRAEGGSV